MAEETDSVPTFHGNFVTNNLNVDDLTIEVRDFRPSHRVFYKKQPEAMTSKAPVNIPPDDPQEIMKADPVVRVVLSFTAASALKQFLDDAIPTTLKLRSGK